MSPTLHENVLQSLLWCLTLCAGVCSIVVWVIPTPIQTAGVTIDPLSAVLTLLVGFVGSITFRFSIRYMDGEKDKQRFLSWLCFSVCMAYLFMMSTNLLLLFAAWSLTSLGLHQLLTFYADRPEAWPPARKKFLISRLGDLALISAIAVIWIGYGTLDLHVFIENARNDTASGSSGLIAVLVALAAITKSAQFPFHSWLPETMESPTPVSALMHAGIINAGGALLLRFAPILVQSEAALLLLTTIGTITVLIGTLSMWAQVKVKRTLAWSTVGQMGFMMVQCGMCVFPAMLLHIVGHGCYKAWNFLRSGSLPDASYGQLPRSPGASLYIATLGTLASTPAILLATWLTGFSPTHTPGELGLTAVLALSIGQMWLVLLRSPGIAIWMDLGGVAKALLATFTVAVLAFSLYRVTGHLATSALGDMEPAFTALARVRAGLPVLALAALVVFKAFQERIAQTPWGFAFHVHALHGFYLGALADQWIERLWNHLFTKEKNDATVA